MSATFMVLLASAAPTVHRGISLRPRLGLFPLVFLALCFLWVGLMRYALPGFGKRLTWAFVALSGFTVATLLPRFLWRGGAAATTHWFYLWVVLPATVVQVAMMAGLVSAPLWVVLGRLVKRRLAPLPTPEVINPLPSEPLPGPAAPAIDRSVDVTTPREKRAVGEGSSGLADGGGRAEPPLTPPRALWQPMQRLRLATAQASQALQPLLSRRSLLSAAPWVLPGGAMIISAYGTLIESRRIVVRRVRIAVPGLPVALHGLRIGQVTDIHISSMQTQLGHLERALELLAAEHPDIVCPTGDLCDEQRLHRDVLRLIKQVPARLGHFACLGNHELYLGSPDWLRRGYDSAQIQLLEDESVALGPLRLGAVGYPHSGNSSPRMDTQVVPGMLDAALRERKAGETTVLLSHHPHVFQQIGGRGVALQLSGHTHGGQLGLGDGSWIEPIYPLARGHYQTPDGKSQLFVSAGLGHWLPFRVNCPPEVVLIELVPA